MANKFSFSHFHDYSLYSLKSKTKPEKHKESQQPVQTEVSILPESNSKAVVTIVENHVGGNIDTSSEIGSSKRSTKSKLSKEERRKQRKREQRKRQIREARVFCKKFFAFIFSHIGLSGLIVGYIVAGGILFQRIELTHEDMVKQLVWNYVNNSMSNMITQYRTFACQIHKEIVVKTDDNSRLMTADFEEFVDTPMGDNSTNVTTVMSLEDRCHQFVNASTTQQVLLLQINVTMTKMLDNITRYIQVDGWNGSFHEFTWNLAGALLFVVTIITTIGYGHAAPKTTMGRIATMLCAFFGIPLMFLYLNNIGDYLAHGFRLLYINACRPYLKKIRIFGRSKTISIDEQLVEVGLMGEYSIGSQMLGNNVDMFKVKTDYAIPLVPRSISMDSPFAMHRQLLEDETEPKPQKTSNLSKQHSFRRRIIERAKFDSPLIDPNDPSARKGYVVTKIRPAKSLLQRAMSSPVPDLRRLNSLLSPYLNDQSSETATDYKSPPMKRGNDNVPIIDWPNIDSREFGAPITPNDKTISKTKSSEDLTNSKRKRFLTPDWSEPSEDSREVSPSPEPVPVYKIRNVETTVFHIRPEDFKEFDPENKEAEEKKEEKEDEDKAPTPDDPLTRRLSYISMATGESDDYSTTSSESSRESDFESRKAKRKRVHQITVPLSLSIAVMIGYVALGAVLFTIWEEPDYIKWSYFCFITLSTIGFGDIVPGTEVDSENPKEKLIATSIYVAVGLSVFAMCFKLMQEEVVMKVKRLGRRFGIIKKKPSSENRHMSRKQLKKRRRKLRKKLQQRSVKFKKAN